MEGDDAMISRVGVNDVFENGVIGFRDMKTLTVAFHHSHEAPIERSMKTRKLN